MWSPHRCRPQTRMVTAMVVTQFFLFYIYQRKSPCFCQHKCFAGAHEPNHQALRDEPLPQDQGFDETKNLGTPSGAGSKMRAQQPEEVEHRARHINVVNADDRGIEMHLDRWTKVDQQHQQYMPTDQDQQPFSEIKVHTFEGDQNIQLRKTARILGVYGHHRRNQNGRCYQRPRRFGWRMAGKHIRKVYQSGDSNGSS